MRRLISTVALLAATICSLPVQPASAAPASWTSRLANVRACPSPWWRTHSRTAVRRLVICEARLFGVSTSKASYVAWRESRYWYRAYNDGGCGGSDCGGIFQHGMRWWYGRVRTYASNFRSYWWNVRTQCVVTMRMVRSGGWGPWGG